MKIPLHLLVCLQCLAWVPAISAQPTPAQLEHIATLVESGKVTEAKIHTETLLEVFPDDPQLKQMAALLAQRAKDKPTPPPNPALDRIRSALTEPAKITPAPPPAAPEIAPMERLEIQTVLTGANQAFQIGDATQRATRLRELLARPVPSTALNAPQTDWLPYWQARAVAALGVEDYRNGWQAGQALLRLNALTSKDPALNQVMANLNLKGWLKESVAAITQAKSARYAAWLGEWTGSASYTKKDTHSSAGTATIPVSGSLRLKVALAEDLSPRIEFSGSIDTYSGHPHYFGSDRWGWTFYRTLRETTIPGVHTYQSWFGQEGQNYNHSTATYNGLTQAGIYELLRHEFSPDMNELTLHYRLTAPDNNVYEKNVTFRMATPGQQLTFSNNPFFTEVQITGLTREKR